VDGTKLKVLSGVGSLGAIALDQNFNPTVLTTSNFKQRLQYHIAARPALLDSAAGPFRNCRRTHFPRQRDEPGSQIHGRHPGRRCGRHLEPGVGVYRLVGGVNNFTIEGADNTLTGNAFLQVGPQINNVLTNITNSGNFVFIRNSNNFTGGTQIARTSNVLIETGGSAIGDTPLGTGAVEVYGELRVRGPLGSLWNASTNSRQSVLMRPSSIVRLTGESGITTTAQGQWGRHRARRSERRPVPS